MRELKYAILGLVKREPITGYDITKYCSGALSKFWDAKHSQIYPELKRLVDEGLVEYKVTIQGEKLEKKLYTITEAGNEELYNWLDTDEPLGPVPKDAFRLRLYFADSLSRMQLRALFKGQIEKLQQRVRTLELSMAELGGVPEMFTPDFAEYLLITGGIYRDKASIDWIKNCMELTNCSEQECGKEK